MDGSTYSGRRRRERKIIRDPKNRYKLCVPISETCIIRARTRDSADVRRLVCGGQTGTREANSGKINTKIFTEKNIIETN